MRCYFGPLSIVYNHSDRTGRFSMPENLWIKRLHSSIGESDSEITRKLMAERSWRASGAPSLCAIALSVFAHLKVEKMMTKN